MELITATECLKILKEKAGINYSKGYFSQLSSDDKNPMPSHHKPGSTKKWYIYDEVLEYLNDREDPRRDAQREANAARRKTNDIFSAAGKYESVADLTPEQAEARRKKMIEVFRRNQEKEVAAGVQADSKADEDLEKMDIKALNRAILEQDLRIKTATANEKENMSVSVEKVKSDLFAASRVLRDGMLGIPSRLSARIAAVTDPHTCRTMMEEEIIKQLSTLSETLNEF